MITITATYPNGGAAVAYHPQPQTAAEQAELNKRLLWWFDWGYHVFVNQNEPTCHGSQSGRQTPRPQESGECDCSRFPVEKESE